MTAPEKKFAQYWQLLGGCYLFREYKFHPKRRWRFDFALPAIKIAFEIEGGVWTGGRHTRGSGYIKDREKYMEAVLDDWSVVSLTPCMITTPNIERLIKWVDGKGVK
jgi:hypothetical protein